MGSSSVKIQSPVRMAVLFISSEMDEVGRMSDRIVVLRPDAQGRIPQ